MSNNINILKYLLFIEYLTPQSLKDIKFCHDAFEISCIDDYIKNNIEQICDKNKKNFR
ncbi:MULTISPECIES: hypothetical protein [Campylobacter]|uniref:hypothetical protein n=1 Tax=Campylobacter TaxID=194 RepID=UPI00301E5EE1|nr:hypothetical protein [Campylobacter sp. W0067]